MMEKQCDICCKYPGEKVNERIVEIQMASGSSCFSLIFADAVFLRVTLEGAAFVTRPFAHMTQFALATRLVLPRLPFDADAGEDK